MGVADAPRVGPRQQVVLDGLAVAKEVDVLRLLGMELRRKFLVADLAVAVGVQRVGDLRDVLDRDAEVEVLDPRLELVARDVARPIGVKGEEGVGEQLVLGRDPLLERCLLYTSPSPRDS